MAKIKIPRITSSHSHLVRPRGLSHRKFKTVYWPYLPLIILIGLLISIASHGALQNGLKNPTSNVLAYASSMRESELLRQSNQQRQKSNSQPLQLNPLLQSAAQAKADDMAKRNYWSHKTPEGNPSWSFVADVHYSYQKLAENLATGFDNEDDAIKGWLASPEHKVNLLDNQLSDVGFGIAQNASYSGAGGSPATIVVAFLGQPASGAAATAFGAVKGSETSQTTSQAELSLSNFPFVGLVTFIASLVVITALAMVAGRHITMFKRAAIQGERFVIKHPFIDVSLIVIAALSYLLTRTAGYII